MLRRAFITGITGQDGSYLAELLLKKGYEVHGLVRRASTFNTGRIEHLYSDPHEPETRLFLHYGDLTDGTSLMNLVLSIEPDEIYNLAAQSHVPRVVRPTAVYRRCRCDWERCEFSKRPANCSSADRCACIKPRRAKCSARWAKRRKRETTPFHPRSPYACAKVFSYYQTVNYREAYGCTSRMAFSFNHESPWRGETFVTRKITRAATRIHEGLQAASCFWAISTPAATGAMPATIVEAMWLMLQQDEPDDYVIATGEIAQRRRVSRSGLSPCRARLGGARFARCALSASGGSRPALGRRIEGPRRLGWYPRDIVRRAGAADGGFRLGTGAKERLLELRHAA